MHESKPADLCYLLSSFMSHRPTTDDFRWARVEPILDRILEYEGDRTRDELLLELCGEDEGLRCEVESLLESADRDGDLLDQPLVGATPDLVASLEDEMRAAAGGDRSGRTIDRYRLLEVLGRGGMGVVYLAERADEHFEKKVALKLMPRGLESPEKERRFLTERQILARLEHPGIARLLDGGVTEEAYPYLVMEYVEGVPIDRYCDENHLSLRQRLELISEVCSAVHYAHQNLVVHRDLKPGNIFVTDEGKIKLLDFGVGKVLEESEDDQHTIFQPMTIGYASPEQILNQPVSTASDVYSLGVLSYRLLTGVAPMQLGDLSPGEIERVMREGALLPPSQALGEKAEIPRGQIEGDLDTIVMKALRFEPDRRYGSAREFSEDILRHLDGLPIKAHPSTLRYRARKFAGRHRLAVGVGLLASVLLVLGVTTIAWQGRVAANERDRAKLEAQRAEQVSNFLIGLFDAANPETRTAGKISVRDLLDRGESRIRQDLGADLEVRGSLLGVMSDAYTSLGDYARAEELAESAIADLRSTPSSESLALARALIALGRSRLNSGAYQEAIPSFEETLTILRETQDSPTKESALAHRYLGMAQERSISTDMGAGHHRTAIDIWRQLGLEGELAKEIHYLAGSLDAVGDTREGLRFKREALAGLTAYYGELHPYVASVTNDIAYSLHRLGDNSAAEPLYRKAIEINTEILGPEHTEVAQTLTNLGRLLMDDQRFDEAEPVVHRAVVILQKSVDETNFERIGGEVNLASLYVELGRNDEAIPIYRSALQRFDRLMGPDDIPTVRVESLLARALHRHGELGEAESLYRHAVTQQRIKSPVLALAESLVGLGAVLCDGNRVQEALPLLEEGLAINLEALTESDWRIAASRVELAGALIQLERFSEADQQLEAAQEAAAETRMVDPWIESRARRFSQQLLARS